MPPAQSKKPALSKLEASNVIKKIIAGEETAFHLVPFKKYRHSHQGSYLKSDQYEPYFALCYPHSMFHAGFFVCPYVRNGFCPVEDGMFAIDTRKGGTNRFGRHTDVHKKNAGFQVVQRQLAEKCRETVSEAAATEQIFHQVHIYLRGRLYVMHWVVLRPK